MAASFAISPLVRVCRGAPRSSFTPFCCCWSGCGWVVDAAGAAVDEAAEAGLPFASLAVVRVPGEGGGLLLRAAVAVAVAAVVVVVPCAVNGDVAPCLRSLLALTAPLRCLASSLPDRLRGPACSAFTLRALVGPSPRSAMLGSSLLSAAAPALLLLCAALDVTAAVAAADAAGGCLAPVTAAPLCMLRRWSDASICMVDMPHNGERERGLQGRVRVVCVLVFTHQTIHHVIVWQVLHAARHDVDVYMRYSLSCCCSILGVACNSASQVCYGLHTRAPPPLAAPTCSANVRASALYTACMSRPILCVWCDCKCGKTDQHGGRVRGQGRER